MSTSVPPPNWQPTAMPPPGSAPHDQPTDNRQPRTRPKAVAALVAVGLLAGVAFALFGSSATKVSDPVAEAATLSSSAAGYRVHMVINVPSPSSVTPITGVGDGTVDARDHAATITLGMNLGSGGELAQALGGSTLRITELVDGTAIYMKLPAIVTSTLGGAGKQWLKLDLTRTLHFPGLAAMEGNPATSNPSQLLQYLRAVSGGVVAEGLERVDGFETTHYHADLSLDSVVSALPASDQAAAQQTISALEQTTHMSTIPVDVWVDSEHLVRRMAMTISATLQGGQPMGVGVTMDFSDYGPQPPPTLPPAGDVQDLSSLAAAAGQ